MGSAIEKFSTMKFDPDAVRKQAEKFDRRIFDKKMLDYIEKKWEHWQKEMIYN